MLQYTVFITGANRGLGLEFVRQYASDNWRVLASCRSLVHAKELQHLAQHFENVTLIQLDINNQIQLHQLADKFSDVNIDLLINTAGIHPEDEDLGNISIDTMKQAFVTNAIAPLKLSETFLDNVSRSHLKTIVSISNRKGSIADNNQGENYSFRVSKAALNMVMKNLAVDLKPKNIKVFSVHPGSLKIESQGQNNILSPEQSVSNIRSLLHRLTERETGNFFDSQGAKVEW
jgi:NAD(P)-dependent dehydrogenase (short-subunit alcohol dehydrogenase family)